MKACRLQSQVDICDEDMQPCDMTIDRKVSLFQCFDNDKTKNWLVPNIDISKVLRPSVDDDGMWMHHAQDPSWGTRSSKRNTRFIDIPIVLYWKGRNFFILSVVEVNEHLMEKLV